jgi:hypothetical protein
MSGISIRVDWDPGALKGGKLGKAVRSALRKAGSTSLRDMRSEATKRVRARKRLRAGFIRKAITMSRPKGGDIERMEWALHVSGAPVPLIQYPHTQRYAMVPGPHGNARFTKAGISVRVNKGRGKQTLIKPAFLATMKSGHRGIFVRRGNRRLPIDERFASRVTDALRHPGELDAIVARGRRVFGETYNRLLPLELDKVTK